MIKIKSHIVIRIVVLFFVISTSFLVNVNIFFKTPVILEKEINNFPNLSGTGNESIEFDWIQTWGGVSYYNDLFGFRRSDYGHEAAVDSKNDIYLVGETGSYGSGMSDFCLVKYDEEGNQLWNRTWGASRYDSAMDVAVDSENNVYIAGSYHYYVAGEPQGGDMAVVKYNSSGDLIWQRTFGGGNDDDCYAIAIDSNDNIYLAGARDQQPNNDFLIAKYNKAGTLQWSRVFGGQFPDTCYDVAVDSNGYVYLVGNTNSYGTLGWFNFLIVKYNTYGTRLWYQAWGGSSDDHAYDVEIDSSNNIYVAGHSGDPDQITVVKFSNSGTYRWHRAWSGGSYFKDQWYDAGAIVINNQNLIYITGSSKTLRVYNTSGDLQWTLNYASSGIGTCSGLAFDSHGNLYFGGKKKTIYNALCIVKYKIQTPIIEIISPFSNSLYGFNPPEFEISIYEPHLNKTWYSLNNGINYTFSALLGLIEQTAWDACGNGTVTIRFYANNTEGDTAFEEIKVRKDIINPIWNVIPQDQFIEYGDNLNYQLNASDPSSITSWWINNTSDFNISPSGLLTNSTVLAVNHYYLEVRAYDPVGNYCNTSIKITVQDTTAPTWDISPTDQFVEFGNSLNYDLDASDLSGIADWWINDTSIFNISQNGLIFNIIDLPVGIYWLEIRAYDTYMLYCTATIMINVSDTLAPTWDLLPTDQYVEFGGDLYYDLDASDLSGIDYWWLNDTLLFNISENGLITNVIPLTLGIYWLKLRAYDPYNHYCEIIIMINVSDTVPPSWEELPTDQYLRFGEDLYYNVNASDLSGIDNWWINDIINFDINQEGIIRNSTRLSVGIYYLEIRAYDSSDNYCSALVCINIEKQIPSQQQPSSISGYNLYLLIGYFGIISIILFKRRLKS